MRVLNTIFKKGMFNKKIFQKKIFQKNIRKKLKEDPIKYLNKKFGIER